MMSWETYSTNGNADRYTGVWGNVKGIEVVWEPGKTELTPDDLEAIKEQLYFTLTDSQNGNRVYEQILLKSAVNGNEVKVKATFDGVNCFYNGCPAVFTYTITDSPTRALGETAPIHH